jgi:hypothetical protein
VIDAAVLGKSFKLVCDKCGSLSIRVADPESASATPIIECGRCRSPRGTWAALRELARRPRENALEL